MHQISKLLSLDIPEGISIEQTTARLTRFLTPACLRRRRLLKWYVKVGAGRVLFALDWELWGLMNHAIKSGKSIGLGLWAEPFNMQHMVRLSYFEGHLGIGVLLCRIFLLVHEQQRRRLMHHLFNSFQFLCTLVLSLLMVFVEPGGASPVDVFEGVGNLSVWEDWLLVSGAILVRFVIHHLFELSLDGGLIGTTLPDRNELGLLLHLDLFGVITRWLVVNLEKICG